MGEIQTGKSWSVEDKIHVHRSYRWVAEQECHDRNVVMYKPRDPGDVSALVQVPPPPLNENRMIQCLQMHNVDFSVFPLKAFERELADGDAYLEAQPDGSIRRAVDLVVLQLRHGGNSSVLVKTKQ